MASSEQPSGPPGAGPAAPAGEAGGLPAAAEPVVDAEARRKAEKFVEEEEGAASQFGGRTEVFLTAVAVAMSLFHLYAAFAIVPAHVLRATHLGFVLFLLFLIFPAAKRLRDRIRWFDVALSLLGLATIGH